MNLNVFLHAEDFATCVDAPGERGIFVIGPDALSGSDMVPAPSCGRLSHPDGIQTRILQRSDVDRDVNPLFDEVHDPVKG